MLTKTQIRLITFSYVILITGLMAMDLINPSLPYIMSSLKSSENGTKSLIAFYMLGLGLSQFFYGTFSDNYGRKKAMLASYIISVVGIALSNVAGSIEVLCLARFINGIGNGGATVISRAVISDVCNDYRSLKLAFSYFTVFGMLSPTLAPILGGAIQQYSNSWRMCFFALLVITIISGIIVQLYMSETHTIPENKTALFEQITTYISLFKISKFMIYNFASAAIYIFSIVYYAYMPFILFKLGFSPMENGGFYAIYSICLILGALSLAKLFVRCTSSGVFAACCFSYAFIAFSFYIYFCITYSTTAIFLLTILVAFLSGVSAPLTLTLSLCTDDFEQGKKGAASSVQGFVKMFITGIALVLLDFIPLESIASILLCYIILALILLGLLALDRLSLKHKSLKYIDKLQ